MPLISIIVPIYKVEKYLRQCLDSIVNQDYDDYELILVNDGSPDACPQICDEYADKYPFIKVIHKANGGSVLARQTGIDFAKGGYSWIIDSDDYIGESFLKEIAKIIQKYKPDIVAFHCTYFDDCNSTKKYNYVQAGLYRGEEIGSIKERLLYDKKRPLLNTGVVLYSLWSKVIRTDLLKEKHSRVPNEICKGDDLAASIPCLISAESIYFMESYDYYYRKTPNSLVSTFNPREIDAYKILVSFLYKELGDSFENQINVYMLSMFLNYTSAIAKFFSTAGEYLSWMKQQLDSEWMRKVKKAKFGKLNWKEKLKVFCLKHEKYKIFYGLYGKRK